MAVRAEAPAGVEVNTVTMHGRAGKLTKLEHPENSNPSTLKPDATGKCVFTEDVDEETVWESTRSLEGELEADLHGKKKGDAENTKEDEKNIDLDCAVIRSEYPD